MTDIVKVALITATPGVIGSILGVLNRYLIKKVEINTNNKLDKILGERNEATTRADKAESHAEGKAEGVKEERANKP